MLAASKTQTKSPAPSFGGEPNNGGDPDLEIPQTGAGDGGRTRDLLLGKQTHYHCATPARRWNP